MSGVGVFKYVLQRSGHSEQLLWEYQYLFSHMTRNVSFLSIWNYFAYVFVVFNYFNFELPKVVQEHS